MQQTTIRPSELVTALEETEIGVDYLQSLMEGVPFNDALPIIMEGRQMFLDWNLLLATLN